MVNAPGGPAQIRAVRVAEVIASQFMRNSLASGLRGRSCSFLFQGAIAILVLAPHPVPAQNADLNLLSLQWARGRYLSPVICEIDSKLVRGGRRITIMPGPRHARPRVNTLLFSDLDVPTATRCFDDLGLPQPNVKGRLHFRLPGHSRPDSARHDFEAALRRSQGFEFHISEGTLRIQVVGEVETRDVDFRGGTARLTLVRDSTDDARLLRDLTGMRKLVLDVRAEDGTNLHLPIVMTQRR